MQMQIVLLILQHVVGFLDKWIRLISTLAPNIYLCLSSKANYLE